MSLSTFIHTISSTCWCFFSVILSGSLLGNSSWPSSLSALLLPLSLSSSAMASANTTRLSRDDFRKAKELEELRKTGAAPPELDDDGRIINPHIPQYISSAPWYYNTTRPGLKHQYLSKFKPPPDTATVHTPHKRLLSVEPQPQQQWKPGCCDNCGAQAHKTKDCLERPRKRNAKLAGEVTGRDEWVEQPKLDYDGKRDRWSGYDSREYSKVVERYEKVELERKKRKLEQLEEVYRQDKIKQDETERKEKEAADHPKPADEEKKEGEGGATTASAAGASESGNTEQKAAVSDVRETEIEKIKRLKREKRLHKLRKKIAKATHDPNAASSAASTQQSSDSDTDSDTDDEGGGDSDNEDYGEVITALDAKQRVTVRNLRIREDTAKYLRNLNPNSAHYDPKTRSMRENPYPDKRPDEVLYAGDNWVRASGEVKEVARLQRYVWDSAERAAMEGSGQAVEVHAVALPSAAEKLYQAHKQQKEQQQAQLKSQLIDRYGGEAHLSKPAVSLLQTVEAMPLYDESGRLVAGGEKLAARSKYVEDVKEGGHTAVWGSWFDRQEGKWGYGCCHSLIRGSICVGEVGKGLKAEMEREREKAYKREETRQREGQEKAKQDVQSNAQQWGRSAMSREPTEDEMETYHRQQRRYDDPMNGISNSV